MMLLLIVALVASASLAESLTPKHMTRPANRRHTWEEWKRIMANQVVKPKVGAVYPGTEPQPATAGMSYAKGGRIISGNVASEGQFPWQAAVRMDFSYFCGGELISTTVVLTAGHCVLDIGTFEITLGSLTNDGSDSGSVVVSSRNGVPHSGFDGVNVDNDIAIVVLPSAVTLSNNINVLRLPSRSQVGNTFENEIVRVSGWGKTSDFGSISYYLRYVDLKVIANTLCAQTFGSDINDSKICTLGNPEGSPCNGDSGGALTITDTDGQSTQVGIVSFGSDEGCTLGYPAVFTRVTSFLDWISTNANIQIP